MDIKILNYPKNYKKIIYQAGTNCYDIPFNDNKNIDYNNFIYKLIQNNHESVLEHINIVIYIKDIPRSLMEQLTRHRLCSFSIKSTHYADHSNFDFQNFDILGFEYKQLMLTIKNLYKSYINKNIPKYYCREILPISCLTNIIMTTNIREYRLILKQRLTYHNIPLMQELAKLLARNLYLIMPECFFDIINNFEVE